MLYQFTNFGEGVGLLVAGGGEGPVYLGEVHVVVCGGEVGGVVGESEGPVYLGEVHGVVCSRWG